MNKHRLHNVRKCHYNLLAEALQALIEKQVYDRLNKEQERYWYGLAEEGTHFVGFECLLDNINQERLLSVDEQTQKK